MGKKYGLWKGTLCVCVRVCIRMSMFEHHEYGWKGTVCVCVTGERRGRPRLEHGGGQSLWFGIPGPGSWGGLERCKAESRHSANCCFDIKTFKQELLERENSRESKVQGLSSFKSLEIARCRHSPPRVYQSHDAKARGTIRAGAEI